MARISKEKKNQPEEPIEKKLWKTADKLRKNMDAAEYKHIVLGLIFLKYISDAFEELYQKLKEGKGDYEGADLEDKNESGGRVCLDSLSRFLSDKLLRFMPLPAFEIVYSSKHHPGSFGQGFDAGGGCRIQNTP